MEPTKLLTASYLDIVFDGKNKAYGAYELRNNYERRILQALSITTLICMIVATVLYADTATKDATVKVHQTTVAISHIPEEVVPPPKPIAPPRPVDVVKVKSIALVVPKVVPDEQVQTPPPSQLDIADARISHLTQEGVKDDYIVTPPQALAEGKGIVESRKPHQLDDASPFVKVEIDAAYAGGNAAWKNFLERNLQGDVPVYNGAGAGVYTVKIQFIVDRQGNISDLKPLTSIGFGMEAEAMRVLKKSGKWKPAIQNGREVTAYRTQPITFQVLEQ